MTGPRLDAHGGIATCARCLTTRLAGNPRIQAVKYVDMSPRLRTDRFRKLTSALLGYLKFLAALGAHRPDLVHIHTSRGGDFWRNTPLILACTLTGRPMILHVHPADAFARSLAGGSRGVRSLRLSLVNKASLLIVPSEVGRRALTSAGARRPVVVLVNPVELSEFTAYPLTERARRVIFMGSLVPQKGVYDLVAVLGDLAAACPGLTASFFGPYGADRIGSAVREAGLEAVTEVGEWIDGRDKTELLGRSRVLALPSYSEGLPLVILEALASGTPCVTTIVGGMPEIIAQGVNGYLVEPGDRNALRHWLGRLLVDDDLWQAVSREALKSSEQFDAERVSSRLVRHYEEVLLGPERESSPARTGDGRDL